MPDKLIQIQLMRVIPAEKWRIIRLITKVKEFPQYVPCVKEAELIHKQGTLMRTRWRVQINGVPLAWTEEDRLVLQENCIYFKAIDGDMAEFAGKWSFADKPEGTQVQVDVQLRVGIPAIHEFANAYVKKLLTQTFEMIMESVERRLISTRYAAHKTGVAEKIAGFGIVGHLYNFYHLEKSLKMLKPDFKMPSREFLGQLFHVTPSFKLCDINEFKSKTGQTVNGCVVVATFIPDMIDKDMWVVFSKVIKACKIAEKSGVGIVTLGGFTSIVAERIGHEVSSEVDVPVTTGNTFTAAMAVDGVVEAARRLGVALGRAHVAIIGGTGDIGSACARELVDQVRLLTITGRAKASLRALEVELSKPRKAKIVATADNWIACREADIVIACASASSAILNISWFKPGAIVCDVGYPKNVSYLPILREDILIFSGGLTTTPSPICFPFDMGLPSVTTLYGCYAEAIILALEKRFENYSRGKGAITPEKVQEMRALGKKHGFEVADFYWGGKLLDAQAFEKVKEFLYR